MENNSRIGIYYPGFTRKAITFTIDDGDIPNDIKFLEIVRPAGILGTFNLSSPVRTTVERYREIYRGYEIANHCGKHPLMFVDGEKYIISDELYDKETAREYTEEDPIVYRSPDPKLFYKVGRGRGRIITDKHTYLSLAIENRKALEEIFGEGSVKGFAWPYRRPKDEWIYQKLCAENYTYLRDTRIASPETCDFNLGENKMQWPYTVRDGALVSTMQIYDSYPDDGNLKFFSFGVHARDYENHNTWDDLREFARIYGNRPNDYFYATNAGIIEYEAATKSLIITDTKIENPSDIDVYVTVDGKQHVIRANSTLEY